MGVCPLSLLCGDDYVLWKCADYSLYVWQLEMGVGGGGGGGGGGLGVSPTHVSDI